MGILISLQFLRILSDDEDNNTACDNAEVNLAETIESITLKFDDSFSASNDEAHTSKSSDTLGEPKLLETLDVASASSIGGSNQDYHGCNGSATPENMVPLLKEDYFAFPPTKHNETVPDTDWNQEENDDVKRLREVQMLTNEDNDVNLAADLGSLTQKRKLVVLYELLAAAVADIPEEGDDVSRSRRGYDARQRVALRLLATWLNVNWNKMVSIYAT